MFSSRLPDRLAPNRLTLAVASAKASGTQFLDLTVSNPSLVGLEAPAGLLAPLADPAGALYRPEPLGMPSARAAVARSLGRGIEARDVVLTASTSEAYSFLFKLFCDAGDAILVPQPSYPLFDLLAALDAVHPSTYRLEYHGRWSIDRASVERALTPRTRALLVVSPNNPTGSSVRASDREWLVGVAERHDLAIVSDEVFGQYPLARGRDASTFLGESRALTCTLGGLSKAVGLPQVKLGWIVLSGPEARVDEARARLEIIADTYLSVSTAVQLAAPSLIEAGASIRQAIASRLGTNLATLESTVTQHPAMTLYPPEGGWSAVLRVPAILSEEELVIGLFERAQVLVHPGYFFDFVGEAYVVVSLLPRPDVFAEGLARVAAYLEGIED